tara:strand:+ start:1187 stop:1897 length:711 start_codon:yes stop_codon:yes gene_type:complete
MSPKVDFFYKEEFSSFFNDLHSGNFGRACPDQSDKPHDFPGRGGTVFCVATGNQTVRITNEVSKYEMQPGMYGAIQTPAKIEGGMFWYVFVEGYECLNGIGGPLEHTGRLRYIDGCTDSLILPPVIKGDPCLNLLYFPPSTDQTFHTHPSCRIGLVVSGRGICHEKSGETILEEGLAFYLPKDAIHRFETKSESLRVVAFHPDSDFGPEHDFHPMINKTMVDGTSARHIEAIRTSL